MYLLSLGLVNLGRLMIFYYIYLRMSRYISILLSYIFVERLDIKMGILDQQLKQSIGINSRRLQTYLRFLGNRALDFNVNHVFDKR